MKFLYSGASFDRTPLDHTTKTTRVRATIPVFSVYSDAVAWATERLGPDEELYIKKQTKSDQTPERLREVAALCLCNHQTTGSCKTSALSWAGVQVWG